MARLEDLQELSKAINRNKVKNIHIIGNGNSNTLFDEFYHALLDDKFNSDEEYAQFFYGKNANYKAYYKLKDRLQERLINTIFFVDVNMEGLTPLQKAYYQCYKNAIAIKILLGKSIRNSAIRITEKTLKQAIHYEFTDIVIELANHLKIHFGNFILNKKKFFHYNELTKQQFRIYEAEIKSEEYRTLLYLHHHNQTVLNPDLVDYFEQQFQELNEIIVKFPSYRTTFNVYLFFFMYFELKAEWYNLIDTSDKLLNYLKTQPKYSSPNIEGFAISRKLVSLFILRKFHESQEVINNNKFPIGSFNWLFVQDFNFRIQLHTKKFAKANEILQEVEKYYNSTLQYLNRRENWKIFEAFIHYLIRIGKIPVNQDSPKLKPFRLAKFLNEVPTYSKDKKGSNITILILQVLFLLEQRKYDTIIDRTESLKAYTHRYLKDDGTYRSNCFIKMLLCLPAASFQKEKAVQKAKKYLNRLLAMPIEKAKQSAELEVMPYEMLWEFVLESLDRQKK